ncbi:MAG: hypothetical protein ACLFR1_06335 [Spirochaetia bacterium]
MRKFQVSIIGSSYEIDAEIECAKQIGSYVAQNSWIGIHGGRGGVMRGFAQGIAENNGTSIAILPGDNPEGANEFSSIVIPAAIGHARNSLTGIAGDAIVVIGGGAGTLSEVCFAWIHNKPIVACAWLKGTSKNVAGTSIDNRGLGPIKKADCSEEVFQFLTACFKTWQNRKI